MRYTENTNICQTIRGIKMIFKTLSEYDDEIKKIDKMIDNWEELND